MTDDRRQPIRLDVIVGIDDGDQLGIRVAVLGEDVVQSAGFGALQAVLVDEAESVAQLPAVLLDRHPDAGILGVVVDHENAEVLVIESREVVECLAQDFRRFVVCGDLDLDAGRKAT